MKMEYIFIKFVDNYCKSKDMFINFLDLNDCIKFNGKDIILYDGQELKYILDFIEVEKSEEIIFHLMVESFGNEEEQAVILEKFDSLIKEINEKLGKRFSINTIWNDVSSYYGRKLYPDISNVENMLRKIIYLFMLKTVGSKWLDTSTPEKFQQDISSVIEKNNKKRNEINEEWLIYADFITLGYFFTAPYALKSDLSELFNELKQYENNESKNKEKSRNMLTENVIKELSDEYEPKNNWDRYFSDKLSVKSPNRFSKDWSSLYEIRNKVAHGKPIGKAEFDKAIKLIDLFKEIFEECIKIIDTVEVTAEEAEAVEIIAQKVIPKKPKLEYTFKSTYPYQDLSLDLNMDKNSLFGNGSANAYISTNIDNLKYSESDEFWGRTGISKFMPRNWSTEDHARGLQIAESVSQSNLMASLEKPLSLGYSINLERGKKGDSIVESKNDKIITEENNSKSE